MKALSSRRFQPGEGPSRGLLSDCTTGCGTDGALHSTTTSDNLVAINNENSNEIICHCQCFNSQPVTELAVVKTEYKWEVIGSSLHPTVALVNHCCDPNTFRSNTISKLILYYIKNISGST